MAFNVDRAAGEYVHVQRCHGATEKKGGQVKEVH